MQEGLFRAWVSGTNTNEQGARLIRYLLGERMGEVGGMDPVFSRIFSALKNNNGGDEESQSELDFQYFMFCYRRLKGGEGFFSRPPCGISCGIFLD